MNDPSQQLLVMILVEKIAELGDQYFYRYHVYGDGWDWGYWPTRIQLKAIARLLYKKFGRTMPLYTAKLADLENIREGKQIPRSCLGGCLLSEPSLEDYAMTEEEHFHAKEIAELPEVLEYIEEHNIESFIAIQSPHPCPPIECISEPESSPEPSAPTATPPKTGKRAQNNQTIWEPVRTVARALWAEEGDSLNISDAIRRIQKMPHLQASARGDSNIRKHIADLAPLGVRGKPGRKLKKST